jgi:hypothetical protein
MTLSEIEQINKTWGCRQQGLGGMFSSNRAWAQDPTLPKKTNSQKTSRGARGETLGGARRKPFGGCVEKKGGARRNRGSINTIFLRILFFKETPPLFLLPLTLCSLSSLLGFRLPEMAAGGGATVFSGDLRRKTKPK